MNLKILIVSLIVCNFLLVGKYMFLKSESLVINSNSTELKSDLSNAYDYSKILLRNSCQFSKVVLPDSLAGMFMLYIPRQGCNACIDSSLLILSDYKKRHDDFKYFVFSQETDYLKKFMRYNRITADIVDLDELDTFKVIIDYPLLTFNSGDKGLMYTIPILKGNTKSLRYLLQQDINKLFK